MQNALIIVHQATSDPGRVGRALRLRGIEIDQRCPALGHALPDDLSGHDGVVIFGGPQSANDEHLDYLRTEYALIDRTLAAGKPFLGLCLGAQMLARAIGGSVAFHPEKRVEIGYWPIMPTDEGRDLFGDGLTVMQWHREGISLPDTGVALAHSERFENQAFQYGENAFGLQFHCELTTAMQNRWLVRGRLDRGACGAQDRHEQLANRRAYDQALRGWLDRFMTRWTGRSIGHAGDPAAAGAPASVA